MHQALYCDEGSGYGVTYAHLTWCDVPVGRDWVLADEEPMSCLWCLNEVAPTLRVYTKPGVAIINTRALSKINFDPA